MTNRIPLCNIEQPSSAIIDATLHNPAIRLYKGFYQKLRRLINIPLIALFLLAPWLTIKDAPMLWMDIEGKKLHLLGVTLWPSDLTALIWIALASAFALFAAANFAGRLWCGFACPQTIWSLMFSWVEEKVQGSRNQRLKQLNLPWRKRLFAGLILKHSIWLTISFITAFTFVAYFETGPVLWETIQTGNIIDEQVFWLGFFAILTYINAGWLREQVCLHMCPYARFQSVMLDKKSLKVSYDQQRGEPRNTAQIKKNKTQTTTQQGHCIDCTLCVQVCPVGIDIRQGLQYACIDCGACIDACDDIMAKIQQPKGLIRFTNNRKQHWSALFKNRARLFGYLSLAALSITGLLIQMLSLESFNAHLSRDRGQLFFYGPEGDIQNAYQLKIQNKTQQNITYSVFVDHAGLTIAPLKSATILVNSQDKRTQGLVLSCTEPCELNNKTQIKITVQAQESPDLKTVRFIGSQEMNTIFFAP